MICFLMEKVSNYMIGINLLSFKYIFLFYLFSPQLLFLLLGNHALTCHFSLRKQTALGAVKQSQTDTFFYITEDGPWEAQVLSTTWST